MTSATEELRRLLDERGVDHEDEDYKSYTYTYWGDWAFTEPLGAKPHTLGAQCELMLIPATPEQAIAATLGDVECVPHGEWESISQSQEVRHVFCECGYELGIDKRESLPFERTKLFAMPNYCQECGRKIRKAVKR